MGSLIEDHGVPILTHIFVFAMGLVLGAALTQNIPKDFSCTESAVIEGYATCVKYERDK